MRIRFEAIMITILEWLNGMKRKHTEKKVDISDAKYMINSKHIFIYQNNNKGKFDISAYRRSKENVRPPNTKNQMFFFNFFLSCPFISRFSTTFSFYTVLARERCLYTLIRVVNGFFSSCPFHFFLFLLPFYFMGTDSILFASFNQATLQILDKSPKY